MTENNSRLGLYSILTLVFVICVIIILNFFTPSYEEPIYHTLPDTGVKTESGRWIKLTEEYPDQDLLLLFYVDTSETAVNQLVELSKIADQLSSSTTPVLIHIGRSSRQLPVTRPASFLYVNDPEAEFTRSIGVDIVPTLLYVARDGLEILFSEGLITSEEIIQHIKRSATS